MWLGIFEYAIYITMLAVLMEYVSKTSETLASEVIESLKRHISLLMLVIVWMENKQLYFYNIVPYLRVNYNMVEYSTLFRTSLCL